MKFAIKIIISILVIAFNQNVFADICDFEYSGDYYTSLEYSSEHSEHINSSYTLTGTYPDGKKAITIHTLLGDNCFERREMRFDSTGNLIGSYSYIMKDNLLLQIAHDSIIMNINYGKTPCNFTIVESSNENAIFHFDDSKNEIEYKRLEKEFGHIIYMIAKSQENECQKYKKYKKYMKDIEWLGK